MFLSDGIAGISLLVVSMKILLRKQVLVLYPILVALMVLWPFLIRGIDQFCLDCS